MTIIKATCPHCGSEVIRELPDFYERSVYIFPCVSTELHKGCGKVFIGRPDSAVKEG